VNCRIHLLEAMEECFGICVGLLIETLLNHAPRALEWVHPRALRTRPRSWASGELVAPHRPSRRSKGCLTNLSKLRSGASIKALLFDTSIPISRC
jgi:hypothetical protein